VSPEAGRRSRHGACGVRLPAALRWARQAGWPALSAGPRCGAAGGDGTGAAAPCPVRSEKRGVRSGMPDAGYRMPDTRGRMSDAGITGAACRLRSADLRSAVSRVSNPQMRACSVALRYSGGLPTGSRRYGRLETCATRPGRRRGRRRRHARTRALPQIKVAGKLPPACRQAGRPRPGGPFQPGQRAAASCRTPCAGARVERPARCRAYGVRLPAALRSAQRRPAQSGVRSGK
jgi:hypothetical protein